MTDFSNGMTIRSGMIEAVYTNWRGETRSRQLAPLLLWYGSTEWHPEPQWFLRCHDMDELGNTKDFALSGFVHPPVEARPAVERAAAVVDRLRELLEKLPDEERVNVFLDVREGYCQHCGCDLADYDCDCDDEAHSSSS